MQHEKEELYEASLHNLRILAREIGVYAPTRLTKKELIHEIVQIESGEKPPCAPIKRGRPPKNDVDLRNVENKKAMELEKERERERERLRERERENDREHVKKEMIDTILKAIEKKLNKLL